MTSVSHNTDEFVTLTQAMEDYIDDEFGTISAFSDSLYDDYQSTIPMGNQFSSIPTSTFDSVGYDIGNAGSVLQDATLASQLAFGAGAGVVGTVAKHLPANGVVQSENFIRYVLASRGLTPTEINAVAGELADVSKTLAKLGTRAGVLFGVGVVANDLYSGNGLAAQHSTEIAAGLAAGAVVTSALGNAAFVAAIQSALVSSIGASAAAIAVGVLTSPIVVAVLALGASYVIAKAIGDNWGAIEDLGNSIAGTFSEVADAVRSTMDDVYDGVASVGEEVKERWDNFTDSVFEGTKDVPDYVTHAIDKVLAAIVNPSPLVLDLDGDGVELYSLTGGDAVYWDLDVDGFAEASGWINADDGFLTIDLNEDGIINDSSEMFGDQTGYSNGFLALAGYDSNNDGLITSADIKWSDLTVWKDENGDGHSQDAELYTLDELLISQIDLGYSDVSYQISGNDVLQESSFRIDGNARDIVDVYFSHDNV